MKKIITSSIIILITNMFILKAQEYTPFPTTNAMWNMRFTGQEGIFYRCNIWMEGDTAFYDKQYKKLYLLDELGGSFPNQETFLGGLREENKRIYYIGRLIDVPICDHWKFNDTSEVLLYDFNLKINDTLNVINECIKNLNVIADTLNEEFYGKKRKGYFFNSFLDDIVYQGVGSDQGLFTPLYDIQFEWGAELTCFEENIENFEASQCIFTKINDQSVLKPTILLSQDGYKPVFLVQVPEFFNGQKLMYSLYNMDGKIVKQDGIGIGQNSISTVGLQPGVYVVGVTSGHEVYFRGKVLVW